jgi:hypothetical protein
MTNSEITDPLFRQTTEEGVDVEMRGKYKIIEEYIKGL